MTSIPITFFPAESGSDRKRGTEFRGALELSGREVSDDAAQERPTDSPSIAYEISDVFMALSQPFSCDIQYSIVGKLRDLAW